MKKKSLNISQLKLSKETINNLSEVTGGAVNGSVNVSGSDSYDEFGNRAFIYDNYCARTMDFAKCAEINNNDGTIVKIDTLVLSPGAEITLDDLSIVNPIGDEIAYA